MINDQRSDRLFKNDYPNISNMTDIKKKIELKNGGKLFCKPIVKPDDYKRGKRSLYQKCELTMNGSDIDLLKPYNKLYSMSLIEGIHIGFSNSHGSHASWFHINEGMTCFVTEKGFKDSYDLVCY